ncbi:MAG TPA: hypothetical protein V6C90_20175 [Coleofasciculaceae cyanobacterium]|jgi:hypothetical protein
MRVLKSVPFFLSAIFFGVLVNAIALLHPININRSTMKLDLLYKYSYDFCCQPTNRSYSPT